MTTLLERERELLELSRHADALRATATGVAVLIEGVPGIGKTALLDAMLERCEGLTVLRARGSELEGGLVFGGVRQLFAETVLALDADERDALLTGPAGLAADVLGVDLARARDSLADPLYGLYWLVAGLSERGPLVLAIDDLHWLDVESGRFAGYLAQRLEGLPVLLVATARSPEPGVPLAAEAAQAAFATVIRPTALSVDAAGALLAGRPPAEVHRLSGGNPLLVLELGRSLAAAQAGTPLDELGSANVARLVLARVGKVSPAAGPLARAVALFAGGAELEDASAIAELDARAAAEAADGLIAVQVFADGDRLAFVHPLTRTAIYEQLGPFERRRGHGLAAARLKERGAAAEEIAAHLLVAKPEGDPENVRILRAAADEALRALAPRAAARYLERAIAEPPSSPAERAAMLRELGNLQVRIAHPDAQATLQAALEQTADPDERADVAIELGVAAFAAGRYGEAATSLARLREGAELDPERGMIADSVILASAFEARSHPELRAAAVARLPRDLPGDTPAQRLALHWLAWSRQDSDAPAAEVAELAMRSVGEFDDEDLTLTLGVEIGHPAGLLVECGELDVALTTAEERADRARELGVESAFTDARLGIGIIALMRGELRDAEGTFRLTLESPGVQPHIRNQLERFLLTALILQGRLDEAERTARHDRGRGRRAAAGGAAGAPRGGDRGRARRLRRRGGTVRAGLRAVRRRPPRHAALAAGLRAGAARRRSHGRRRVDDAPDARRRRGVGRARGPGDGADVARADAARAGRPRPPAARLRRPVAESVPLGRRSRRALPGRRDAPRRRARRGAPPAARCARLRGARRCRPDRRAGARGARARGRPAAQRRAHRRRLADPLRNPDRAPRRGRAHEQGGRAGAVPHRENGRVAPAQRVPQARDRLAPRPRRRLDRLVW